MLAKNFKEIIKDAKKGDTIIFDEARENVFNYTQLIFEKDKQIAELKAENEKLRENNLILRNWKTHPTEYISKQKVRDTLYRELKRSELNLYEHLLKELGLDKDIVTKRTAHKSRE